MSSPFTTLSVGGNAQSLAMANEIVLAYSERRQVLGQSAVSALSTGDNAQDKTLWLAMQTWMEANCTSFIDHVNGPLNPAETDFLYFTLATWRAAAGLNASGYRRSTDGTTMLYGNIQSGDVRGKWTFEDFQKGFGVLKWTWKTGGSVASIDDSANAARSPDQSDTCSNARASQIANWPQSTYGSSIYILIARLQGPTPWWCVGFHATGKSQVTSIPTFCSHSAECYLSPSMTQEYEDMENLFAGNGKFVLWETFVSSSDSSHILSDLIGDYTVNPVELSSIAVCPDGSDGAGIDGLRHQWLLKWNFTNE